MDHQSLLSVIKPLVLKKSKVHSLSMSIRTLPSTYKVDFSCDKMNFFIGQNLIAFQSGGPGFNPHMGR